MRVAIATLDNADFSHATGVICQGLQSMDCTISLHSAKKNVDEVFISNGAFPPRPCFNSYVDNLGDIFSSDLVMLDVTYTRSADLGQLLPFAKKLVVIDSGDNAAQRECPSELLFFCSHLNRHTKKYKNEKRYPLPFGISQELVNFTDDLVSKKNKRIKKLASNFTPTDRQSVRAMLALALVPKLEAVFKIDKNRYDQKGYIENLNESLAVLSYCGEFIQDIYASDFYRSRFAGMKFTESPIFELFSHEAAIARWDSWRFYESLASASLPIQLDFSKYGFELPKIPTPFEHYIPIDLEELGDLPKFLSEKYEDNAIFFEQKGVQARDWAIEQFGPAGMAKYIQNVVTAELDL
jgi:hypothetical protein